MIKTRILPDSLVEYEFQKPCQLPDKACDNAATWLAWISHEARMGHTPMELYLCDSCKGIAEYYFIDYVNNQSKCTCGFRVVGKLSDNFRVIRL